MKSFLSYLGGKSLLAPTILARIPAHRCYCEVFAGAAWILFRKDESPVEIINDVNTDLVNLYRIVKHHLDEFTRYLRWMLVARDEFARCMAETPGTLTDIQRAVRFYYLMRCGYGGKVRGQSFAINPSQRPRFNLLRVEEELSMVHLRLSRVYVENMDYAALIPRFDRENTFFYLDPPYYGFENCYGTGVFSRDDFVRLSDILADIKGTFLLSINDVPEIRKVFKTFCIEPVTTTYTAARTGRKQAAELLISNYDQKQVQKEHRQ